MNTAAIISALPTMPPEVLAEINKKTAFLLGGQPADAPSAAGEKDLRLVHEVLNDVVRRYGDTRNVPLKVLRKSKYYTAFKNGAATVVRFVDEYFKPATELDRAAAIQLVVGMTARAKHRRGQNVSLNSLSCSLGHVAQIADREFPGYRQCGMLPHILKMRREAARV